MGQARYWNMPFTTLGTCLLLGHALQHAWDMTALETGPSASLGPARSWEMPFQLLWMGSLLGLARKSSGDTTALGTRHSEMLGTGPPL